MKRCKACNKTYPDNYNYCTQCGAKLEIDFWGTLWVESDEEYLKSW